jgi:hypothetical protein
MFLRYLALYLQVYTALQPWRQTSILNGMLASSCGSQRSWRRYLITSVGTKLRPSKPSVIDLLGLCVPTDIITYLRHEHHEPQRDINIPFNFRPSKYIKYSLLLSSCVYRHA